MWNDVGKDSYSIVSCDPRDGGFPGGRHGWCYAWSWGWGGVGLGWGGVGMITFFALAHMVGATQHHFPCACTHGWCYATSCFSHLHTWSVVRNIMFLALAHMVGATQHHVSCTCTHGRLYATSCFLHLHTWSVVCNTQHHVSCTCTHGRLYATSCFLHLHTWSVVRIMQALRCHKMKCMSGLVSPTDAFKKPLWQLWLTCSKKKCWLSGW